MSPFVIPCESRNKFLSAQRRHGRDCAKIVQSHRRSYPYTSGLELELDLLRHASRPIRALSLSSPCWGQSLAVVGRMRRCPNVWRSNIAQATVAMKLNAPPIISTTVFSFSAHLRIALLVIQTLFYSSALLLWRKHDLRHVLQSTIPQLPWRRLP